MNRPFFILMGCVCLWLWCGQATGEQRAADVLVRGGTIVDGTGWPMYTADLAIVGDRIAAIGRLEAWTARTVIDARGLHVAPGFIDAHSHAEGGLVQAERSQAQPQLAQGITTVVVNPDGGGPVDLRDQRKRIEAAGPGVNVALMIGHNTVRRTAMGGNHDRAPSAEELQRMRELVRDAMEAGAFGMTSGLFYIPGSFAQTEEVIELARIVAEYDGVHSSHIRDESDYNVGVVASVNEIIDISRASGVTGVVTHIKALGPGVWGESRAVVDAIAQARAQGVEVWADQYPYDASATSLVAVLVPAWAREGNAAALVARLKDESLRPRIRDEMLANLARRGGAGRLLMRDPSALRGLTLEQIAQQRGLEPVDAAIALFKEGIRPGVISFNMHEDDIHHFMRQPFIVTSTDGELPTMGEGMPHPRTYGAFARKIRKYVREEQVLDLPQAIASMTGTTARIFRMHDRGTLRPGMMADVVIFDLQAVDDPATYEQPHQLARGFVHVIVNGELVVHEERFTEARPGRVLQLTAP